MDSRDDLVPMVRIKEIAPRLAGQAHSISTEHKVELIDRLTAAGVRAIEATSFVRPDLIPGLADAEQVLARVRRTPGVTFECCVGNELGIRRAAAAGADRAWFLLSADERFARDNIGRSTEESLELLDRLAEVARDEGIGLGTYVIFAWGGPDGPARGGEAFEPIGRRLREVGVEDWILADSAGYASPRQLASLVECAAELTDMAHLTVQIHDARGMGLAGVATLVRLGLRNIDTSLAGSGGHPAMPHLPGGGVCTEDVVQMLDLLGVSTGIDLAAVVEAANWLEQELGVPGLGYVRRVGPVPTAAPGATTIGHFHWTEI
ncbi:hypothetical protein JL108_13170 [Aeromicrobium sp. YIM 150415]|uniref:hypothetical protein n=1 Tax=Aeromicrobium sp. YIM 150415 TaxID=2803912 RepID=UPI001962D06B|nr:hypothetical protein [Aeromicrobium sp. YIM 150415]MBM9464405.1 hypothetical protein [Aeromicrobium sp. YIM 150415]